MFLCIFIGFPREFDKLSANAVAVAGLVVVVLLLLILLLICVVVCCGCHWIGAATPSPLSAIII